jgi:alpha-N-arabinofuranosidase
VVLNIYRLAKEKVVVASIVLEGKEAKGPVKLKVDGNAGKCDFRYSLDGKKWIDLAKNVDATNLSTQLAGGFIGTCIGLYATANHLQLK